MLPVKFRWIPFSGFREEVENVSANQRPGRPSCFSNRPLKYKLGRGHWDLASCQVLLNSDSLFQRGSRKCLRQSEARAAFLFFRSAPKNTNLVEDNEILLPVKFRWIPFSSLREEVENVSANQRPWWPFCFSDRPPKNHNLCSGHWDPASCQVLITLLSGFKEVENVSANQMPERPSCFSDRSEKHKLSKRKIKSYFLSSFVKIPFNDFREDVENV